MPKEPKEAGHATTTVEVEVTEKTAWSGVWKQAKAKLHGRATRACFCAISPRTFEGKKDERMRAKFKEYLMLDGSRRTLIERVGSGRVIRRFDKTPFPRRPTDVVCAHFMELAWSWGCPYNCSYCYLKGTYRFFIKNELGRVPMHFKERGDIAKALTTFLRLHIPAEILNTGELSDSLMGETQDPPFSKWLMNYMNGSRHKVMFLTKGTYVKNFLDNEWQKNAILSWSLNAEKVAKRWEHLTPSPKDRIKAAELCARADYEVRIRIDPMVSVEGWREEYRELIDSVFSKFRPERITLGCLRGLASTIREARDKSWIKYLDEGSGWGKKPNFERRLAMYGFVISYLDEQYDFHKIGICKDTMALWRKLNMDFRRITCNCVS